MILNVSQLSLAFGSQTVLQDFSFHLAQGEIACLLGQSGCGKTTALRCMAGFETPKTGQIVLNGQTVFSGSLNVPAHKRKIGMVFQDYALFPHLTVSQNIAFGLQGQNQSAKQNRVAELLQLIDLQDYGKHYPHQLSGGQQQRVALARALAPKPDLILLDEPFSSLDADLRTHLSHEVRRLLKQENTGAIMVTHDQQEAFVMADKVGVMAHGRLEQWDTPAALYQYPATLNVAKFVGQGVFLAAKADGSGSLKTILGDLRSDNHPQRSAGEKRVLVRPEHLVLHHDSSRAVAQGEILVKQFVGNHFDLTVRLTNGETVSVDADLNDSHQVGDHVGVGVVKRGGWAVFDVS